MAQDTHTIGRKRHAAAQFSKLVTYCYDRFDLNCGMADLFEKGSKEHRLTQRRAVRWAKRAQKYIALREWEGQL